MPLPDWWNWELEFTPHLERRMRQRRFTEVELRRMLETASGYRPNSTPGRWIIESRMEVADWEIIVEPDTEEKVLVVITAYPC